MYRDSPLRCSHTRQEEYNDVFENTPITTAMTKSPITIGPGAPLSEAVQILHAKKVGGLLVVENDQLKGIADSERYAGVVERDAGGRQERERVY
jgi:CBS domain-containing protein